MDSMTLRVLAACECSGEVRRAFRAQGHDAWSCDLKPAEDGSEHHITGDAIAAAYGMPWDLMIAHPTCRYLANSGAKHLYRDGRAENGPDPERWARMGSGAAFFLAFWNAPIERICIENPIMIGHAPESAALREKVARAICKALGDDWFREGEGGLIEAYGPVADAALREHDAARGWRPIETAPKDGTRFLGYEATTARYFVCQWRSGEDGVFWSAWQDSYWHDRCPTHWRPLPPPPAPPSAPSIAPEEGNGK